MREEWSTLFIFLFFSFSFLYYSGSSTSLDQLRQSLGSRFVVDVVVDVEVFALMDFFKQSMIGLLLESAMGPI